MIEGGEWYNIIRREYEKNGQKGILRNNDGWGFG